MDHEAIRERFKHLAEKFAHLKHFDAPANCFVLRPCLSDAQVADFEHRYQITLPQTYRDFLTHIGNGSLGPSYELFPLGWLEGRPWQTNEVHPRGPYPFVAAWNLPKQTLDEFEEADEADSERLLFEHYWKPEITKGSVPISDLGCGSQLLLIVDGPRAGQVWKDGRADHLGLMPLLNEGQEPITFDMWLMEFIEKAER